MTGSLWDLVACWRCCGSTIVNVTVKGKRMGCSCIDKGTFSEWNHPCGTVPCNTVTECLANGGGWYGRHPLLEHQRMCVRARLSDSHTRQQLRQSILRVG